MPWVWAPPNPHRFSSGRIGPSKIQLLEEIDRTGSISAPGRAMKMSYRGAWQLVEDLNRVVGKPVVAAAAGGGARLTPVGHTQVNSYRAMERSVQATADKHLAALVPAKS